jgi:hypothetical protein
MRFYLQEQWNKEFETRLVGYFMSQIGRNLKYQKGKKHADMKRVFKSDPDGKMSAD